MSAGFRPHLRPLLLILRPFVALAYASGAPTRMSLGVPMDEPSGTVAGHRPLRALVAGGMSGSGIGIASFGQSVACQFAGTLSRATERGVDWESIGGSSMRLSATASAVLAHDGIGGLDLIVVTPGISDVLAFTSLNDWSTELEVLLERLRDVTGPSTVILVSEVLDVARYVSVGRVVGRMLSADSAAFNAAAREICAANEKAHLVTLPRIDKTDYVDGAFSYSTLYRRWGRSLAGAAAAVWVR